MLLDQSKRVIIRIWTSENNKLYPGHNVGHIAIETPDEYISLWPVPFTSAQKAQFRNANILKQQYQRYFMECDPNFHSSYENDYVAEGGIEPQVTLCFYSLDPNKMLDKFDKLKSSTESWRLIGSNLLVEKLEEGFDRVKSTFFGEKNNEPKNKENCSSLAAKILKAGKINELLDIPTTFSFSSKTSSVVTPDELLNFIITAKKAELKKHPETQEFEFPNETIIEPHLSKSRCGIL